MRMEIVKMRIFFVKMLMNCENANKGRATKPGKKGRHEGRRAGQKQWPTLRNQASFIAFLTFWTEYVDFCDRNGWGRTAKDASLFCRRSRVTQEKDSQIHKKDSHIHKTFGIRFQTMLYLHRNPKRIGSDRKENHKT